MDVQPRDRDPSDLARRAANASELISGYPSTPTLPAPPSAVNPLQFGPMVHKPWKCVSQPFFFFRGGVAAAAMVQAVIIRHKKWADEGSWLQRIDQSRIEAGKKVKALLQKTDALLENMSGRGQKQGGAKAWPSVAATGLYTIFFTACVFGSFDNCGMQYCKGKRKTQVLYVI